MALSVEKHNPKTIMKILFFGIFVLIIDLCHSVCPMVSSAKHGELSLSEGEKVLENCEGLTRFKEKKTGKMFCLKKKGKILEKLACVNCLCGQENKPSGVAPRVVGGENVTQNQYPWYALIFLKTISPTSAGENLKQMKIFLLRSN